MIKELLKEKIDSVLDHSVSYVIEIPYENFGDYSTNVAMKLTKILKASPISIAENIIEKLKKDPIFKNIECEKGFINFSLSDDFYVSVLNKIKFEKLNKSESLLIEFGSANPTGPLHVGHGSNLIIGDILSSLLSYAGYRVTKEYYVNDHGVQIDNLVNSVDAVIKENRGEVVEMKEEYYKGDYIKDIANLVPKAEAEISLKEFALNWCLDNIKSTLKDLQIDYDSWTSEASLYDKYSLKEEISKLRAKDLIYEKEEAIWIKTSKYGDEKDRVVIKNDGNPSYFASDVLYSKDKVSRNYDKFLTLLGADHHGYVPRYVATFRFQDFEGDVDVKLLQLVSFLRSGEKVRMSKRAGNFFTLQELINEIGNDACRIMFISKKGDTPLDFDIDLAKEQSSSNPLFYMQYAHARICSLLNKNDFEGNCLTISSAEEKRIIKKLSEFNEVIEKTAKDFEVNRLFTFTMELASLFHSFYNSDKIASADANIKQSKLFLASKVRECLVELFGIFKIEALEEM